MFCYIAYIKDALIFNRKNALKNSIALSYAQLYERLLRYNKWCHPCAPFFVIPVLDTGMTS
ncbi:hypothetical protein [Wolbachia endosymbiont (group A) of Agelastica alni]|uniref:hypothetical protein n=1 Tax=Wolbachia endosymbiont (group A) of Agelastica alni TaxID=3066130 RepID=UPI00333E206E